MFFQFVTYILTLFNCTNTYLISCGLYIHVWKQLSPKTVPIYPAMTLISIPLSYICKWSWYTFYRLRNKRFNRFGSDTLAIFIMKVRKLPPNLQEKAIKELNENPKRIEEDVKHLKTWLSKQSYIKARTGKTLNFHSVACRNWGSCRWSMAAVLFTRFKIQFGKGERKVGYVLHDENCGSGNVEKPRSVESRIAKCA